MLRAFLLIVLMVTHATSLSSFRASAQSIGINFVGAAGEAGTLQPTDVAGVPGIAQASWNNVPGTTTNLLDNSGRQTTMSVTWGSCGVGTNGSLQTGADFNLMRGSLTACAVGIGVHLTKIPYSVYDVIVYLSGSGYSGGVIQYLSPANFVLPTVGEGASPRLAYSNDFAGTYIESTTSAAGHFYQFSGLNFDSVNVRTTGFSIAGLQVVRSPGDATVPTLLSATLPGTLGSGKFWLSGTALRFEVQLFYPWFITPKLDLHGPAPPDADGPLIANLPDARCVNIEVPRCNPVTGTISITPAQATALASDLGYLLVTPQPASDFYRQVRAPIVNESNPTPALQMHPLRGAFTFQWPTMSREFRLESAPSLSGPWQSSSNEVGIAGDAYSVVVYAEGTSQFFRLRSAR